MARSFTPVDTLASRDRDYDRYDRDRDRTPTPTPDPEPTPTPASVFGEYGTIAGNHNWQRVTLQNAYVNPVVIFSDPTFNGGQPVAVRLRNVGAQSFEFSLQEPAYLDGLHVFENLSYMVVEAGTWNVGGMVFTAGNIQTNRLSSAGFDTVALPNMGANTSVMTQVQTSNGADWVTTRTDAITGSGFRVTMQEEEAKNTGTHVYESIGYLAFSGNATTMGDTLIQGGLTPETVNQTNNNLGFAQSFTKAPTLFTKVASFNGADTANSRITGVTASGFSALVQEEQSLDVETTHLSESLAFLAFGGSSGNLVGTQVLAAVDTLI
jgi:hypothetical protein